MEESFLGVTEQRRIVERVLAGDRSAEDEFVRWFQPRVYATLVGRTADREASRDLAQDAMIAALRTLRQGGLEDPEKLSQFIQGIARNLAYSYVRTRTARRPRENMLRPELEQRIASPLRQAELETAAMEENVERALQDLEAADRDILLWTMQGRKPREIAGSLNLTSEVVRQRKFRAIQRIKDSIKRMSRTEGPRYLTGRKGPG
jgi:RNA polymerase sigma factor (sigma-70 family)